jgi:putative transposase
MDGEDERLGKIGAQRFHAVHLCTHVNAYAERFVRSIKESCLDRLIFFGEASLRKAIRDFVLHYHEERNHQGKGNQLLFPRAVLTKATSHGKVRCQQRLGGLLKYYHREAA